MKLRILRGDHPRLSVWARNPKRRTRAGHGQGDRGWSDAATVQGMLAATRENSPFEPLEGARPSWHLEFGLLALRHFVALSHQLMVLCYSSHRKLLTIHLCCQSVVPASAVTQGLGIQSSHDFLLGCCGVLGWPFLWCDARALSISVTFELGRNADTQASAQTG